MYTTTTTTLFSLVELIESRARLQSAAHRLQVFYRPNGKISIKYRWNERVGGEGWKYGEETSRRDFQAFISLSLSLSLSLLSLSAIWYDTRLVMYTRIRVTMAPLCWTHCENLPRQIAFFRGSLARSFARSFVGSTTDNSELPICTALSLPDTSQRFFTHYEWRTVLPRCQ